MSTETSIPTLRDRPAWAKLTDHHAHHCQR